MHALTRPFRRKKRPARAALVPPPDRQRRPRELAAELLKRLEFKVLKRLDGYLFGDYTGLFYGPSLDLAEVREYQPGDEVRRIDWNVTARTGTVHVRQYREEREITAWIIVDLSPSMSFGTRRVLKRDAALEFAGLVASVLSRQGNKVGAMGLAGIQTAVTPLGAGRKQALAILQGLLSLDASLPTPQPKKARPEPEGLLTPFFEKPARKQEFDGSLAGALEHTGRTLRRRSLVFVVSDFIDSDASGADPLELDSDEFDPDAEPNWGKALRRLAYRHDVIAVRISDPAERELPKAGDLRLRDPETGQELWVDTGDPRVRKAHAALVARREAALEKTMRAAKVDVLELSTERDIVQPILAFTLRRSGRRA